VKNLLIVGVLAVAAVLVLPPHLAFAQPGNEAAAKETKAEANSGTDVRMFMGASVGAGLVMLGAGLAIGRIGASAVEGMSRQPEVAGNIQTGMIISAAIMEGATFFALAVCLIEALG